LSGCVSGSWSCAFFLGDSENDDFLECLVALWFFSGERDNLRLLLLFAIWGRGSGRSEGGRSDGGAHGSDGVDRAWSSSALALGVMEDDWDDEGVRPKSLGSSTMGL
jgi:hypothetical protein